MRPLVGFVALLLLACHEESRRFQDSVRTGRAEVLPAFALRPGPQSSRNERVHLPAGDNPYATNAWGVSEGKRLFTWYNCSGCHSNGGGGMGPALMDSEWLYGSEPRAVYTTIAFGRPNGMPAFGQRAPETEIWKLVSYVRSLGNLAPMGADPGRNDATGGLEPESQFDPPHPPPAEHAP